MATPRKLQGEVANPVFFDNTAPEYEKVRAIFEDIRNLFDEMLRELQQQR